MHRSTPDDPNLSPRITRNVSKGENATTQQSNPLSPRKRPSRHLKTEETNDLTRASRIIRIFGIDKEIKSSDAPSTSGQTSSKSNHDIVKTIKIAKVKKEIKEEEKTRPLGLKRLTREMQKEKDRRAFKAMGSQLKGSSIDFSVIPSDRREGLMKFMDEKKEHKKEKKTTVEQKENTRIEEKIAGRGHSNRFAMRDAPEWVKQVVVKSKKNDEDEKGGRKWDHVFAPDHNFLDVEIVPDGVKRARKGMN